MKAPDKVIWDSGFGYEIGFLIGEGKMYDTYEVELVTGVVTDPTCRPKSEVKPYSKELIRELTKKYKYEKDWADTF